MPKASGSASKFIACLDSQAPGRRPSQHVPSNSRSFYENERSKECRALMSAETMQNKQKRRRISKASLLPREQQAAGWGLRCAIVSGPLVPRVYIKQAVQSATCSRRAGGGGGGGATYEFASGCVAPPAGRDPLRIGSPLAPVAARQQQQKPRRPLGVGSRRRDLLLLPGRAWP